MLLLGMISIEEKWFVFLVLYWIDENLEVQYKGCSVVSVVMCFSKLLVLVYWFDVFLNGDKLVIISMDFEDILMLDDGS